MSSSLTTRHHSPGITRLDGGVHGRHLLQVAHEGRRAAGHVLVCGRPRAPQPVTASARPQVEAAQEPPLLRGRPVAHTSGCATRHLMPTRAVPACPACEALPALPAMPASHADGPARTLATQPQLCRDPSKPKAFSARCQACFEGVFARKAPTSPACEVLPGRGGVNGRLSVVRGRGLSQADHAGVHLVLRA
jgi:hypothetical protein